MHCHIYVDEINIVLTLEASKQIMNFIRVHDEAAASGEPEARERANSERAELKKIFDRLREFKPDPEKSPTVRSMESMDATRREVEVTLINHESFVEASGEVPDDTELDDLIHRLSTTNIIAHEDDDDNKTEREPIVESTGKVKEKFTESQNIEKQKGKSVDGKTPDNAEISAASVLDEQTPSITHSNGKAIAFRQQDVVSRGSRRSKGRTSTIASSKREAEKEKNEVKIRFM